MGWRRTDQLVEPRQLPNELRSNLFPSHPVEVSVQTDAQARRLACEGHGVTGPGAVDEQARAGEDSISMVVENSAVDTAGDAEVVAVDNQELHACQVSSVL